MKARSTAVGVLTAFLLQVLPAAAGQPCCQADKDYILRGKTMHATGTFEVKTGSADVTEIGKQAGIGRMTIDKIWIGGVEGSSKGEMLTGITLGTGSMAYTALEKVTAKIDGKAGTFFLLHRATMLKADASSAVLEVTVVPSSGTGDLTGLTGTLAIDISGGGHRYDLAYQLP